MPPVASPEMICCSSASMSVPCLINVCSIAEVGAPHGGILLDVVGRSGQHHAAGFKQIGVVGEIERKIGVLFDQKHADLLLPVDGPHDGENLPHHQWRQPERRL